MGNMCRVVQHTTSMLTRLRASDMVTVFLVGMCSVTIYRIPHMTNSVPSMKPGGKAVHMECLEYSGVVMMVTLKKDKPKTSSMMPTVFGCLLMKRCKGLLPPTVVLWRPALVPPGSLTRNRSTDILRTNWENEWKSLQISIMMDTFVLVHPCFGKMLIIDLPSLTNVLCKVSVYPFLSRCKCYKSKIY